MGEGGGGGAADICEIKIKCDGIVQLNQRTCKRSHHMISEQIISTKPG